VGALIFFLVIAVLVGFALTLAVGWIVILPVLIGLAALVWAVTAFAKGQSPSDLLRRTRRPELLGPGGPDDPDRGR
jgi:hypothetical protein